MATSNLTFSDWRTNTNTSLMSAAEELLERLEDTADLLSEIDEKYVLSEMEAESDDHKSSIIQRFHKGLDSARDLVNVLKREKWRLNKREMSVEMTMGELEDYKRHLKNDVSSLNQTVDALSMRVVQLENQLAEAQETQETLEAELEQHRNSLLTSNDRNIELYTENEDLKKAAKELNKSNVMKENQRLKDEVSLLSQENSKLKDMVRAAEARCPPFMEYKPPEPSRIQKQWPPLPSKEDNLSKLRKEFLEELSSLELSQRGGGGAQLLKVPVINVQADV